MSTQITEAFVSQFRANVFHLSQQKGSRLRPHVRNEAIVGDESFFDRLGKTTAQKTTSRHSDTPLVDTPHSRRRIIMSDYKHADLIDKSDKVRMLQDPTSDYLLAFVWAFGRAMDDEIIAAADGNAFSGPKGATSVAHPNSQKIASVSGGAGANSNVQLLRRIKKLLDENEVDPSIPRFCALTASNLENLLGETEVTSSDFNTVKALVMGEIDTFLSFNFIRIQSLLAQSGALSFDQTTGVVGSGAGDADTYRRMIFWGMDGLLLGVGQDIEAKVSERDDKNYSTQAFVSMTVGATRMEEEKVVIGLAND